MVWQKLTLHSFGYAGLQLVEKGYFGLPFSECRGRVSRPELDYEMDKKWDGKPVPYGDYFAVFAKQKHRVVEIC